MSAVPFQDPSPRGRRGAASRRWLAGLAVLTAAVVAAGCGPGPAPRADKTVEVVVTTPITDTVLDYQDFTGRLDAFRTVEIRPRVSGYATKAPFKEGDLVKEGDELFLIDPRSYEADLAVAEANLKLAIADRNLQEVNSGRARRMIGTNSMSKEEFDQSMASLDKAKATMQAMAAARKRAAIYLAYTKVIAPLNGRISRRAVDPGNLVKADDTLLTTLVSDDEVYAYFDVDERTYLDLVGQKPSASTVRVADLKLPVLMRLANEDDFTHPGRVDFVDNRLSGNTGTIRMRGVFENPRHALKSGLFVRIRLPVGQPYQALLIPDEALQSDQGRKFAYVVDADNKVQYRAVKLGQMVQGVRVVKKEEDGKATTTEEPVSLRVIKEGLQKGERVIVSGMQRVRPKLEVEARMQPPPKPPGFPMGKLLNGTRLTGEPAPPKR